MSRCGMMMAACLALSGVLQAQQVRSLQQALDRPIELTLSDASIAEVFQRLEAASGARLVVAEGTYDLLPYGEKTGLAVKVKNATLRSALGPLLAPQALQWTIKDEAILIEPSEPLHRVGRRATFEELQILGALHSTKLQPADEAGIIKQLRQATGKDDLSIVWRAGQFVGQGELVIASNPNGIRVDSPVKQAIARANALLPATAVTWLNAVCQSSSTWYLDGRNIVVVDRKEQVDRQLQRVVSLKYQNASLSTVLLDLAGKARVHLAMEPGVLNEVPADVRSNFNLIMAEATVGQALELISGATGLKFTSTPEGVAVAAVNVLETKPKRAPFFVRLAIPGPGGSTVEVYMRGDELPEEIVEAVQAEKAKFIESFRRQSGAAGATSRPVLSQD